MGCHGARAITKQGAGLEAKIRRKRQITLLKCNGRTVRGVGALKSAIQNYVKCHFGKVHSPELSLPRNEMKKVPPHLAHGLEMDPSEEEVKEAVA